MFYLWMFIKLVTGFAIILAYLNISGRSQFSQMNSIDLVGNFILGGLVGGVIYTSSIPFYRYVLALIIGISILLAINFFCRKFNIFRNVTIGRQIPIIKNRRFIMENIRDKNNKIDMINIASQLNLQGIYSFGDVYYAQVEPNGSITAITDKNKLPSVIVYYDGSVRDQDLKDIDKTEDDLLADVKSFGLKDLDPIFMGVFHDGCFRYVCKDGSVLPPHVDKS
ncbi:DUF421 domain-containing protein [Saccharibacter sp. 17.LH.SD]|uniref:DUF421 domain-containing protein n=1 Tax=Saccharibacter sp. 17.LH.SD TaxID=2689393 RepID=UPI00137152D1|nr:YetF domain-containing protein [Saccharibacter sp. 17.LH.SD]MXV45254.1 DUF421 domain-containing protein [Saccharibacter sp. 17.LH.SD]